MPGQTAMGGLKLPAPLLEHISLDELVGIARDPGLSLSSTPFGRGEGTVYIKGAPLTKGMTKAEMEASNDEAISAINSGLNSAIQMSKNHAGEYGTAVVTIGGEKKVMPLKAAKMLKDGQYGQALGDRIRVSPIKKVPSKSTVRKEGVTVTA